MARTRTLKTIEKKIKRSIPKNLQSESTILLAESLAQMIYQSQNQEDAPMDLHRLKLQLARALMITPDKRKELLVHGLSEPESTSENPFENIEEETATDEGVFGDWAS